MSTILTVSQVTTYISLKLKNDPKLHGVAVKGEISNISLNQRSGHLFFSLRDSGSVIKAVMFSSYVARLRFMPISGMAVIAYGNIECYDHDATNQVVVTQLVPDGEGSEYLALMKLKEKLNAIGVFSAPKKPIVKYPTKIAVVTSPTGAAAQDVKNVAYRRYPLAELVLFPATVQGVYAPLSIVSAIKAADSCGADTIILTRGGGSSEDLSAFNAESVVLAVYNCKTPVISAVGHEINWFLCDLAADLRAPTPSGAAELATPDILDMRREISELADRIKQLGMMKMRSLRDEISKYSALLAAMSVKEKIASRRKELDFLEHEIKSRSEAKYKLLRVELESFTSLLECLGPHNVIERGYALVYKNGRIASSIDALSEGDSIDILMRGGEVGAEVKHFKKSE